jgi:hypothetical protein
MPGPSAERTASRALIAAFVAYVAATAIHIGWVVLHEPFSFDAWNVAVDTHAKPFTLGRFFHYWRFEYTHSNPRVGQAFTYLAYKLYYFAPIATPLAFLAAATAITVLGLGRWPHRRARDLGLWAIAIGFIWFSVPEIGKTMFCRAYACNYVYDAAILLWFLVPLRLAVGGRGSPRACAAYAVLGVVAGMCNEHTGPALCAFLVLYALWLERQRAGRPALVWAGAAGAITGFALLFFAPGQGQRYDGLAEKMTLFGRLVRRGVVYNLDILRGLLVGAAPLLCLIAIVAIIAVLGERPERARLRTPARLIALAMIAGTVMAATLFVSPKLGSRFYIVSTCLLLAGFVALADAVLDTTRRLAPFVALAVVASIYAGYRTIPLYARVARESDARMAALEAAKPHTVFHADAFDQIDESWWFYGDDFRDYHKREMVVKYFDLANLVFRSFDANAPFGASGARIVPRYVLDPPGTLDAYGGFMMWPPKGFDLRVLQHELEIAIASTRRLIAPTRLAQLELEVTFDGAQPALPEPRLLAARWTPQRLEMWPAKIVRHGRSTTREVVVPKDLARTDFDIYVTRVGAEVRRLGPASGPLHYIPWAAGVYWVLACHPGECFVIAATRSGA